MASSEPCTSALMTSGKSLRPAVLSCDIICSSEPRMPAVAGGGVLALLMGAITRDLAGAGFVLDHGETIAGFRRTVEAEHFDRNRRTGFLTVSP